MLVHRPVRLPGQAQMRDVVYTVWLASGAFGLPVFAALILATPGWSGATRARALAWGLALLTITQIASMLVSRRLLAADARDPSAGAGRSICPATRPGGCRSSPPSTTSSRSWGGASSSWWCTSPCSAFGRRRAPPDGAPGGTRSVRAAAVASSSAAVAPSEIECDGCGTCVTTHRLDARLTRQNLTFKWPLSDHAPVDRTRSMTSQEPVRGEGGCNWSSDGAVDDGMMAPRSSGTDHRSRTLSCAVLQSRCCCVPWLLSAGARW